MELSQSRRLANGRRRRALPCPFTIFCGKSWSASAPTLGSSTSLSHLRSQIVSSRRRLPRSRSSSSRRNRSKRWSVAANRARHSKVRGQLPILSWPQKIGVFRHVGYVAARVQGHFVSLGVRAAVTPAGRIALNTTRYRQRDDYGRGQSTIGLVRSRPAPAWRKAPVRSLQGAPARNRREDGTSPSVRPRRTNAAAEARTAAYRSGRRAAIAKLRCRAGAQ